MSNLTPPKIRYFKWINKAEKELYFSRNPVKPTKKIKSEKLSSRNSLRKK